MRCSLWIAQRVPDGAVFVCANQFRIRDILPGNPDQIFNPALPEQLKSLGWDVRDETTGQLDWVRSLQAEEDFHPYFALRRVWRVMSLVAPSHNLPAKVEGYATRIYPFAIKPDQPLTLDALIAIHRDAFEGTPFDMTTGDGAGLFASPYRYGKISCEQAIASLITGYTWITQANANLPAPVAWISLDTARGRDSVITPDIRTAAKALEKQGQDLIQANQALSPAQFASLLRSNALHSEAAWKEFYGQLLVKYNQKHNSSYAPDHAPAPENHQSY